MKLRCIYIFLVCVCVLMCVCLWWREGILSLDKHHINEMKTSFLVSYVYHLTHAFLL